MTEDYEGEGIKKILIHARTTYPIVTAYEFEHLKLEAEIQQRIKPCTIYFILQRPLLYFENVRSGEGEITFEITDNSSNPPLICSIDPGASGFGLPGQDILLDVLFYKKDNELVEPFNDVAALKFRDLDQKFLGWFSPPKFLYEYLSGSISATVVGEIKKYIDYTVHYIGKAYSQDIWDRLTGHHKMQPIVTLEQPISSKRTSTASFEISLLLLEIDGFTEENFFPTFDDALESGVKPIIHKYTLNGDEDNSFAENFYAPKLSENSAELTTEVEAMLVSLFKPKYNKTLFNNYPLIKGGTRSAGYTSSTLLVELLPAILSTKHHVQDVVLPK